MTFKRQRKKKLDTEIKIKLKRKQLYLSESVTYLGIKTDQNLNWKDHINDTALTFNRANSLLFKIRNFKIINITILKTIYFAIFDSHINYANLVWTQSSNAMSRILKLQKRQWELLLSRNCHSSPIFLILKLLKFNNKVLL